MAGVILQPLFIIKINSKRDYLIRRSSAAPPDAPVKSYEAIMGPIKNDARLLEQNLNLALDTVGGAI
jgi:hypothetical protein